MNTDFSAPVNTFVTGTHTGTDFPDDCDAWWTGAALQTGQLQSAHKLHEIMMGLCHVMDRNNDEDPENDVDEPDLENPWDIPPWDGEGDPPWTPEDPFDDPDPDPDGDYSDPDDSDTVDEEGDLDAMPAKCIPNNLLGQTLSAPQTFFYLCIFAIRRS